MQTTIERLDRPSAYYLGRVSILDVCDSNPWSTTYYNLQNKKRKYDRDHDRDERDGGENKKPEKEPEDPLKDATTLYVGNLCADQREVLRSLLRLRRSFYTTEEQIHELFAK